MALYSKTDMIYDDYSWTVYKKDDPRITGEPDSTLLNRKEGYEVLYFINKLAENYNLVKKTSGEKIEKMIKEKLPSEIHSQQDIENWIINHWKQ